MTQPQSHQGPGPVPDRFNPEELQRLLDLRQRGPLSPVLPAIDFAKANHPCDLAFVVDQLIHKSESGVPTITLLAAASRLLGLLASSTASMLRSSEIGGSCALATSDGLVEQRFTDEMRASLTRILVRVAAADAMIQPLLAAMIGGWIEESAPTALERASKEEDFSELQRALISDELLKALGIDRADLDLAASGPGVDS
jgi:hypothetical protein